MNNLIAAEDFIKTQLNADILEKPEIYDRVCAFMNDLSEGECFATALENNRLNYKQLFYVLNRCPDIKEVFNEILIVADSAMEQKLVKVLYDKAVLAKDEDCAKWLLERKYSDKYGKKVDINSTSRIIDETPQGAKQIVEVLRNARKQDSV